MVSNACQSSCKVDITSYMYLCGGYTDVSACMYADLHVHVCAHACVSVPAFIDMRKGMLYERRKYQLQTHSIKLISPLMFVMEYLTYEPHLKIKILGNIVMGGRTAWYII